MPGELLKDVVQDLALLVRTRARLVAISSFNLHPHIFSLHTHIFSVARHPRPNLTIAMGRAEAVHDTSPSQGCKADLARRPPGSGVAESLAQVTLVEIQDEQFALVGVEEQFIVGRDEHGEMGQVCIADDGTETGQRVCTCRGIPDANALVVSCRDEMASIVGPCECIDGALVRFGGGCCAGRVDAANRVFPVQHGHGTTAPADIPEANRAIGRCTGEQVFLRRTPFHTPQAALMTDETVGAVAGPQIDQTHCWVVRCTRNQEMARDVRDGMVMYHGTQIKVCRHGLGLGRVELHMVVKRRGAKGRRVKGYHERWVMLYL